MKFAIIKTGGKQYIVSEGEEITVDYLKKDTNEEIEFDSLAVGDLETKDIEMGRPFLKKKVKGKIVENFKGDKIRVARFKAKVRFRKVKGFRPMLSKVQILSIQN